MSSISLNNLRKSKKFARKLALKLVPSSVVALYGDLGTGKTFLCQEIIKFFSPSSHVTSPTFNLLNIYSTPLGEIRHYDLYRLRDKRELHELGIEESIVSSFLSLIEWPEIISDRLHRYNTWKLYINNTKYRICTFTNSTI